MTWLPFAIAGAVAQLVDGSLGMGFGLTSSTLLLTLGASAAVASAAVHFAEIGTTLASGVSHWHRENVDKKILIRLAVPGGIGAALGATFLASIDLTNGRIFISTILMLLGFILVYRHIFKANQPNLVEISNPNYLTYLGFTGGFVDASGGGGWGPVVTSTLIGQGNSPRHTIGSVNTAEFFVSFATGITFMLLGGIDHWIFVAGLIIGGLFSAPFAAYLTSKLSTKKLLIAVGLLITGISIFNLYKIFG